MKKQTISALLLLAMLASAVSSCGGSASSGGNNTPSDTTVPAETTDPTRDANGFLLDEIPAGTNFGGKEVNILIREAVANTEFFVDEQTGDIVDDALWKRNQTVEDRLGVKLNFIAQPGEWADRKTFNGLIKQSVMAADGEYDLCAVLSNQLSTLTLEGLLTNLNTLDYLDFDKPWWAAGLLDELAVDNKLYFASGDASLGLINGMMCVFYNKSICEDFNIPDLYEIVNNGEWTIDKVVELTKNVYQDLDSDGAKSDADRFGLATGSYNQLYGFIDSFNLQIVERDADGYPSKLVFNNEKVVSAVEKLVSLFKDNDAFITSTKVDYVTAFSEGRVLFCTGEFKDTSSYRDIDAFDYGVVPFPKWDEAQENYSTTARATYSSFCIPLTTVDPNMSAAVLECFASESYRTVSPAYFENALKVKYSRDDETAQMFDLIKSSVTFSFATSYTSTIGDPQGAFKNQIAALTDSWMSWHDGWVTAAQEKLDTTIATLKELQ
ncbi:MAG: hypothetical protein IJ493_12875 [Clostridia bacterium]|nr:hypothetical protein [Clostridia bacterium]